MPTLLHGDAAVRESVAILAYLDAAFPDIPLFGETPLLKAKIWEAATEIDSGLRPPAGQIACALFRGSTDLLSSYIQEAAAEVAAEMDRIEGDL